MNMNELLNICVQYGASDLHIKVGITPILRIHGNLVAVPSTPVLTPQTVTTLVSELLVDTQKEIVENNRELDFSFAGVGGERFRINVYHEKGNLAAAIRVIPKKIWTLDELKLPRVLNNLINLKQGLVLVTGPTGHGKSTTLASMIDKINSERTAHIVTVEDPIEFVYTPKRSIISQREMHVDTHSWNVALKSVLREDPDVVLIGEMRDYETIEAALTIAETGHLVFATLHTNSASQTIDRIVDVFPQEQQQQVRLQLSGSLEAVLSQKLLPSLEGTRTAVMEVLLASSAVRSNIRESKTHMIVSAMQTSGEVGMRTFDMALAEAVLTKRISIQVAREYAQNLDDFNRLIS
jgi:twitching motility protein PilT